jgi:hypothetical protein|uniref:hypothetical protein n=1 Tax=Orrella sp. TaxID=1921583 RepID=UPI004048C627
MSSIDTIRQNHPDNTQPWHELSTQQLKQAGLNISDTEQRKINKSLTRLNAALIAAGFDWTPNVNETEDIKAALRYKENFETYLATYR